MDRPKPMTVDEIKHGLTNHKKWRLIPCDDGRPFTSKIVRGYTFPKFHSAVEFIRGTAVFIDRTDHHPTWENTYNRVDVSLTTWDGADGVMNTVTDLDIRLAVYLDDEAQRLGETTLDLEDHRPRPRDSTGMYPMVSKGIARLSELRKHADPIRCLAWSPNGEVLAVGAKNEIRLWRWPSSELIRVIPLDRKAKVNALAWSPDAGLIASGWSDARVRLWTPGSGDLEKTLHWPRGVAVYDLVWDATGAMLAGVGSEDHFRIWEKREGPQNDWRFQVVRRETSHSVCRAIRWTGHGDIAVAASNGSVEIRPRGMLPDVSPDKRQGTIKTLYGHKHWVLDIADHPAEKTLVSAGLDGTVRAWDLEAEREKRLLDQGDELVSAVDFSSDGALLATKSPWGLLRFWRSDTFEKIGEVIEVQGPAQQPGSIAFHPGQPILASISPDGLGVAIWDASSLLDGKARKQSKKDIGKVEKTGASPLQAFICYASEDSTHRDHLEVALAVVKNEGLIETWSDQAIKGGEEWDPAIKNRLEKADMIFMLVSMNFFAKEYITQKEIPLAMRRHREKSAVVIPILVGSSDFLKTELSSLQSLPEGLKPVSRWRPHADAWKTVTEGVRTAIQDIRKSKRIESV